MTRGWEKTPTALARRAARLVAIVCLAATALTHVGRSEAKLSLSSSWPEPASVDAIPGERVTFSSHSPFSLADVGAGAERDPPTAGIGTLFLPPEASAATPAPAVIMLHGASGVLDDRELTYGRQLAAMGVAALAVDAFAARRDRATEFTQRLLNITEAMLLADAYSALRHFAGWSEVDEKRVALIGFSYGGMAAIYAAHAQVAERYAPDGPRFAGHVSFYAPCLARFEDIRATGAPVLMLFGSQDAIVDRGRCAEAADELRRGGATVETVMYEGAHHQWDGPLLGPRTIGRNLAGCRFVVERDGTVRDARTFWTLSGPFARKISLALCADNRGYTIGRDDSVRALSNRDLGQFLAKVFGS